MGAETVQEAIAVPDSPGPPCPVCGHGVSSLPLHLVTASEVARYWCNDGTGENSRRERMEHCVRRLWASPEAGIFVCPNCSFGFSWPHVGGDEEFYGILHERAAYTRWRWEWGLVLPEVARRFPESGLALDIGAGDGAFLKHLPKGWKRFAIESTEVTRGFLEKAGIRVYSNLHEGARPAAFDLITCFQVIEHIPDFDALLKRSRELLKPGGILVISCPNGEEMARREGVTRCVDMPPNHINRWTPRSLEMALNFSGFEVFRCETQPPRIKGLAYSAYLRLRVDAAENPYSAAARVYRIKSRAIRQGLLRVLGFFTAAKLLPRVRDACLAANFVVFARTV